MLDNISYFLLVGIVILLVIVVVALSNNAHAWRTTAEDYASKFRVSAANETRLIQSEQFYASMYSIACDANVTLAEALIQYRQTVEDLEHLIPLTPSVSPDHALLNMKFCATCNKDFHANHFVVNKTHVPVFDNH